MPITVDDEAGRARDVHQLEAPRLAGQAAHREQQIGKENQPCAAPADDLDEELGRAQEASLRST